MSESSVEPDDQREVAAFLSKADAYGLPALPVDRIDTHISIVWLVGQKAYKLKRAVRFDYVDFSTLDLRRRACEAEVRVNRRTAPAIYVGTLAVTREPHGALALGGQGEPVEWLVEMVRFDERTLFDRLAGEGALDLGLMSGLADAIVDLHAKAERDTRRGGYASMAWVVDGNARAFGEYGDGVIDGDRCRALMEDTRAMLNRHRDLLDARARDGYLRSCHGDLHLRNICLVAGVPTLFDGVEFNDDISCIDVLYDLAFLLMDLWRRHLDAHANVVFNEYVTRTGDVVGLAVLPLFLSCRAAVRAKTSLAAALVQQDADRAAELRDGAVEYLGLAEGLLAPPPPTLVAIGGFSGSGKSTLARALAPDVGAAPGAVVLRSDIIRKMAAGVPPETRLGPEAYTSGVTALVYDTLISRAAAAIAAGHSVIVDAVFADPRERERIALAARRAGVPFTGIWLEAPTSLLEARLASRVHDASDATTDVLRGQVAAKAGEIEWHRVSASGDVAAVRREAAQLVPAVQTFRGARRRR